MSDTPISDDPDGISLDDVKEWCGIIKNKDMGDAVLFHLGRLERENAAMRDLLCSARAIADRKGESTAWERFSESIRKLGIGSVTARTYRVLPHEYEESK